MKEKNSEGVVLACSPLDASEIALLVARLLSSGELVRLPEGPCSKL